MEDKEALALLKPLVEVATDWLKSKTELNREMAKATKTNTDISERQSKR